MTTARRLWPREYGAYAELGFPLLTALIAGRPTLAALALSTAALAWFLLHEPLVVLRGTRGQRLQVALAAPARTRVRWLVAIGALAGGVGLILAPVIALVAALVPVTFGALLVRPMIQGREKTMPAELIMAAGLSSILLPIGVSAGIALTWVVMATGVWFLSFAVATLLVHAVKAWHRPAAHPATRLAASFSAVLVIAGAALGVSVGMVPLAMGLAAIPTAGLALGVAALRVHPRRLKRVGWSLVGANVLSLALLLGA